MSYTVNYAMAPDVRAIDETFDTLYDALEAAYYMVENGQTDDYDPQVELNYLCVISSDGTECVNCLWG